jgi:hypothetical protein
VVVAMAVRSLWMRRLQLGAQARRDRWGGLINICFEFSPANRAGGCDTEGEDEMSSEWTVAEVRGWIGLPSIRTCFCASQGRGASTGMMEIDPWRRAAKIKIPSQQEKGVRMGFRQAATSHHENFGRSE